MPNVLVEVVGVYSIDPWLASINHEADPLGFPEESRALNPPSSLVARLHAISIQQLVHTNPMLPLEVPPVTPDQTAFLAGTRVHLATVLSQALGVDATGMVCFGHPRVIVFLTAAVCLVSFRSVVEYVLMHLISTVHKRVNENVLVLGKFALNLQGLTPAHAPMAQQLVQLLHLLLPKCFYFPMTLENMNSARMTPRRDNVAGRLRAGLLQLSDNTHLILDETVLQPGQLDQHGLKPKKKEEERRRRRRRKEEEEKREKQQTARSGA